MSSRKQQTRSKILDSALRLLVERGYYGVGMEEVARDAGVSRQALYLHFKSKSELLVAMAQHNDEMLDVPDAVIEPEATVVVPTRKHPVTKRMPKVRSPRFWRAEDPAGFDDPAFGDEGPFTTFDDMVTDAPTDN